MVVYDVGHVTYSNCYAPAHVRHTVRGKCLLYSFYAVRCFNLKSKLDTIYHRELKSTIYSIRTGAQ